MNVLRTMRPTLIILFTLVTGMSCAAPTVTPTPAPSPSITAPVPSPSPTSALPTATSTLSPRPTAAPTQTLPRPSPAVTRSATPTAVVWSVRTLLVGAGQPGRLYALLTDQPFATPGAEQMRFVISDDFGATWVLFPGGLPVEPGCLHDINLDYAGVDALYASTCQGLYRWSSQAWQLVSAQETGMVAIAYAQPQNIWATTFQDRRAPILHSANGGGTWQPADEGLVHFNGVANLGIDPRDARTLYAIINPKYGGSYLRRGTLNGNWTTMPTPLNNAQIDVGMTIDGATGDLYVTAFNSKTSRWGVWQSRNPATPEIDRVTWEVVFEFAENQWATLLASGGSSQGLALYVRLRDYTSSRLSLVRSRDGGKTWQPLKIQ